MSPRTRRKRPLIANGAKQRPQTNSVQPRPPTSSIVPGGEASMAPASTPNSTRRRRARRSRHPVTGTLPSERQPVGSLPKPSRGSITPHITVISRRSDEDTASDGESEVSDTPVRTNPSYLTETDPGLDLHNRTSQLDKEPRRQATFADMARVGLGPQRDFRPDHMASHEPVPLHHYMKFKKPRGRRVYPPIDEELESIRTETPSVFQDDANSFAQRAPTDSKVIAPTATASTNAMPNNASFIPSVQPVDALGQHFALVRQTFGRELPSTGHIQGNEGQRDGEVQFTIDGGGDIHAHAWSGTQLQWVNVGLFSYRRKAIEGALGVRQLKGQKIGSVMPRNQIELFNALAKQFEEENSIVAISPTYESTSSRNHPPTHASVELLSPRPQRPSINFNPSTVLSGSSTPAGYGSQQSGFPTMNTFAPSPYASTMPSIQRTMSKMSDDRASFLGGPSHSTSLHESQASSPTNPHNISPLNRRFALPSTAATTFDTTNFSYKPANYAHSPSQASTFGDGSAYDLVKERQMRVWQDEQLRLQQRVGISASREPIFGDEQTSESRASSVVPQDNPFRSAFSTNTALSSLSSSHIWQQSASNGTAGQTWPDVASQAPVPFRPKSGSLSWEDIVNGRPSGHRGSAFASTGPSQPNSMADQKMMYQSISNIGLSYPDNEWEDRKVRIWNGARGDSEGDTEGQEGSESLAPRRRGPFFTAGSDERNIGHFDGVFQDRVDMLCYEVNAKVEDRTNKLREEAKRLTDEGGVPLTEAKVEELATDPLSHLMWAVKFNLQEYQKGPSGQGDYFQRAFTKARPEYIDTSPTGNNSFFTTSCPSSDEVVVFKGRVSQLSSSSESQEQMPSSSRTSPVGSQRGARVGGQSSGAAEQVKRRARDGSSSGAW